ncbi:TPA: type II toxin-antitoxin system HicA family toxin [Raoultella ornithinolytica]|nr:type II toxin-antitoxin system HicA family toxin [Raoultella ornithinolytica]
MSRKEKLRSRLDLLPKDFTWEELVTLLGHYGFKVLNGSGSRRKFVSAEKRVVAFHCPHPSNIVKGYVLEEAKSLLDELDNNG